MAGYRAISPPFRGTANDVEGAGGERGSFRRNESIDLHCSGPLLENGLDRPENFHGRYGFASFSSISISTVGLEGARVCL